MTKFWRRTARRRQRKL